MKKLILGLAAVLLIASCSALEIDKISLSAPEAKEAHALAERRQEIAFTRGEIQQEYQAKINRLNEAETQINIDAQKLCFRLKNNHNLDLNTNYLLDEVHGKLLKAK